MAPCAVGDSVILSPDMSKDQEEQLSERHVHDMAELVAGYLDCMEEAVRYLIEEERYPESHPAVVGLRQHLANYQGRLVTAALQSCPPAGS